MKAFYLIIAIVLFSCGQTSAQSLQLENSSGNMKLKDLK
jgi:hypothetical protein